MAPVPAERSSDDRDHRPPGRLPDRPLRPPPRGDRWLERAFAAEATAVHPPEPDQPLVHAEVRVGTGLVMLSDTGRADESPFAMAGPVCLYVVVDDPDALHARAVEAGAEIVRGLTDQDYGSREFAARDPHGNVWSFGTYRPSLAPSGGTEIANDYSGRSGDLDASTLRLHEFKSLSTSRAMRECSRMLTRDGVEAQVVPVSLA